MAKKHEFAVTVCGQPVFVTGGENRKETLQRAVRYASEYAEAGFPDVAVSGVTAEDWASIEEVPGWPKTMVH